MAVSYITIYALVFCFPVTYLCYTTHIVTVTNNKKSFVEVLCIYVMVVHDPIPQHRKSMFKLGNILLL